MNYNVENSQVAGNDINGSVNANNSNVNFEKQVLKKAKEKAICVSIIISLIVGIIASILGTWIYMHYIN